MSETRREVAPRMGPHGDPAPAAVPDAIAQRFVFAKNREGVWLGDGRWSRVNPGYVDAAPTFTKADADIARTTHHAQLKDAKLVLVWPDMKGELASRAACNNAGLHYWELEKPKQE